MQNAGKSTIGEGSQSDSRAGKYLTFRLAAEEYGLEILKVREIIGLMEITSVPQTPHYIRGVINLRGKVIPVLELRLKFGMESIEDTEQTCIIVVEVANSNDSLMTGIVVDSVSEVLDIDENQIADAPSFGAGIDTDFILGIGKIKDDVKILLDIDKVLDISELSGMSGLRSMENKDVSAEELETAGV
jgi:purine-binding chemotaxis protein CheW